MSPEQSSPDAEDLKLVTLARSARARTAAAEGAAVRDDIGRTYAAAAVDLPSLSLTAVQAAVAAAVSSGSDRLDDADSALLADVSVGTVLLAGPDGALRG